LLRRNTKGIELVVAIIERSFVLTQNRSPDDEGARN
jgi:hypothetical protein